MAENKELVILLVEDDDGHADLIETNLRRGRILNGIIRFRNGKEVVDFLLNNKKSNGHEYSQNQNYLMMLDLNMPVMDGYEVLRKVKASSSTKSMPVMVLTTTADKKEVERSYELGCNIYVNKPVEYERFSSAIRKLGLFLTVVKVPGEG